MISSSVMLPSRLALQHRVLKFGHRRPWILRTSVRRPGSSRSCVFESLPCEVVNARNRVFGLKFDVYGPVLPRPRVAVVVRVAPCAGRRNNRPYTPDAVGPSRAAVALGNDRTRKAFNRSRFMSQRRRRQDGKGIPRPSQATRAPLTRNTAPKSHQHSTTQNLGSIEIQADDLTALR